MLISVIIPVYNAERYIKQCIDSILGQDYSDYEIIVVNDGSTDSTTVVLADYLKKVPNLVVVNKKNEGVSVARNVGLSMSKAEYVVFVDADDILMPNALATLYSEMIENKVDLVLCGSKVMRDGIISNYRIYNSIVSFDVIRNVKQSSLWGYMFKNTIIRSNKISFVPGLCYSEDRVFLCKYSLYSRSIKLSDKFAYIYRKHDMSACASKEGLKKAKHMFWAAKEIVKLSVGQKCYTKKKLNHYKNAVIRMGVDSVSRNSLSISNYIKMFELYNTYFDVNFNFFCKTVLSLFTFLRRKYVYRK